MSKSEQSNSTARKRAVALQYDNSKAPVVVASGMGYLAEKIVDLAQESGVPVYEDNSLATFLAQLKLGQDIPPELYQAIAEIYVYFLNYGQPKVENQPKTEPSPEAKVEPAAPLVAQTIEEPINMVANDLINNLANEFMDDPNNTIASNLINDLISGLADDPEQN